MFNLAVLNKIETTYIQLVHSISIKITTYGPQTSYTNRSVEKSWKNMLNAQNIQIVMTILSDKVSFLNMTLSQLALISTYYFPDIISKDFINSQKWVRNYCYPNFTNEKNWVTEAQIYFF